MNRLGWTLEQQATLRGYLTLVTVMAVLGSVLSIAFVVATGNARGLVLLAFFVLLGGGMRLWYGYTRDGQP